MFSLRVSGCFCGAEKQLSNSPERGNCFLVMRWIDIPFAAVLYISSSSALFTKHSVCDWNASPDSWINTISGSATVDVYSAFQIDTEVFIQSEGEWLLLGLRTLWWVSLTIVLQCIGASPASRRSEEKRTHPAELTEFILFTVKAICKTTFLWILAMCTSFFKGRGGASLLEAFTLHCESWMQVTAK